ncbi:hypothetical protein [Sphingomonas hengshuiensis]|uniref:hypothetical protein n=1 Tax=Sphingomonas hengshuiensis TaxID=1609977 RepID=UPI0012B84FFB|nr:hypothetical protein [Sphingomonas hengshuiensis]
MIVSLGLCSCASLPKGKLQYHLADSEVAVKVTRVLGCNVSFEIFASNTVQPSTRYFAENTVHSIDLSSLNGALSDADIKIELTEDGRLTAINATSTGQGEAILKAAFTTGATLLKLTGAAGLSVAPDACKKIKQFGGDKPLTLIYEGKLNLASSQAQVVPPRAEDAAYADPIDILIGGVTAIVLGHDAVEPPFVTQGGLGERRVKAKQPGYVSIEVSSGNAVVYRGKVLSTEFGAAYEIPLPAPAAFGKKALAITFAESGAVKSMQFASTNGSAAALNAVDAGLKFAAGDTAAQKAAELKAESDLIVQQQRLIVCKTDPANCK